MVFRAAVLGRPIGHSLSPVLHRAAYAALDLSDWRYEPIECDETALPGWLAGLSAEWVGLSLTMPLKRVALVVADEVTPLARAVGAANTLLLRPAGRRHADNTDVAGVVAALGEAGVTAVGRAVVLGAGGTAQAVLAALRELGDTRPAVLVRDPARAIDLVAAGDRLGVRPRIRRWTPTPAEGPTGVPAEIAAEIGTADLVVSTVPAGAADGLAGLPWSPRTTVLDVVYVPWPTPLAAAARAAGCRVVSGLTMLLHQAAAQVELMTGRPAPVEAMRAALAAAAAPAGR